MEEYSGGMLFENCSNFDLCSSRFSDVILATILATKSDMCGKKFELKIDNVRFVGHPTLLQHALGQVRYEVCSGDLPPFQTAWLS